MAAPHRIAPIIITATAAQNHFGALLRRVCRDRQHFIVERAGLPTVAIIPVTDYERFVLHSPLPHSPGRGLPEPNIR